MKLSFRIKFDSVFDVSDFAHRCKPCRQFEPVFEKLAEQNLMRADIVFAKIDAIANEFETIDIPHFPHLM